MGYDRLSAYLPFRDAPGRYVTKASMVHEAHRYPSVVKLYDVGCVAVILPHHNSPKLETNEYVSQLHLCSEGLIS
jgi:hypothetical protein